MDCRLDLEGRHTHAGWIILRLHGIWAISGRGPFLGWWQDRQTQECHEDIGVAGGGQTGVQGTRPRYLGELGMQT